MILWHELGHGYDRWLSFSRCQKNQKGWMGGVGWEGSFSICLAFGTFSPLVLRLPRYLPALHYGVYLRSLPVPV